MQTFLPYPDFEKSAQCLDNKRLGKQRVECLQILNVLAIGPEQYFDAVMRSWLPYKAGMTKISTVRKTPWYNHPAVKMWRGYEKILGSYGIRICQEWINRGFNDTCYDKIYDIYNPDDAIVNYLGVNPPWLGNEAFHASHRSNLLRKDPVYYSQFNWTEPNNLPYIWPNSN